jgi:hypothetical protein
MQLQPCIIQEFRSHLHPGNKLFPLHRLCNCVAAQVDRIEVEKLKAVGLRNRVAAMQEVSTAFSATDRAQALIHSKSSTSAAVYMK